MKEDFNTYCHDFIEYQLPQHEGRTVRASELSWELTSGINADGSATYSREAAIQCIKDWWYDAGEFLEYERQAWDNCNNPFLDTEGFMVQMIIAGVNKLVSKVAIIDQMWDNDIQLTEDTILQIIAEVKELEIEW